MRLPPLPSVSDIVRLHRLTARKRLSQNFLLDTNISKRIVQAAGSLDDCFALEIGPGPGGITRSIFEAGARRVAVVEKDSRFLPGLQFLRDATDNRLDIFHADILRFDTSNLPFYEHLRTAWHDNCPRYHVIGNLPFSISTPLVIKYLDDISQRLGLWRYGRTPLTLTFQKEVAERMVAPMLSDARCRLSIICQYLCDVKIMFTIPSKAFVPAPKVDACVVRLEPLVRPLIVGVPFSEVSNVLRHIFHYRQKRIVRGIRTLFPPNRHDLVIEMVREGNVDPKSTCFMLSMEEINQLCQTYYKIISREPSLTGYDYRASENLKDWKTIRSIQFS